MYVMRDGQPGATRVALYTRCEDELLAKAELVLLMEEAERREPGCRVVGYLDVDPTFTIAEFKRSYRGDHVRYRRLMQARARIIADGWPYQVP